MYIARGLVLLSCLIGANACSKALQAFLDAEEEIEDPDVAERVTTPDTVTSPAYMDDITAILQNDLDVTTDLELTSVTPDTKPPSITINTRNMKGATYSAVHFLCKASGNPAPNFTWEKDGESLKDRHYSVHSITNGSLLRIEGLEMTDQGTYTCIASNAVGSAESSSTLQVTDYRHLPYGFPEIMQSPSMKLVEEGRNTIMPCSASGDPLPGIRWMFDSVPLNMTDPRISRLHSGSLQIVGVQESDQGKYECVAENHIGVIYSYAAHLYVRSSRRPIAA